MINILGRTRWVLTSLILTGAVVGCSAGRPIPASATPIPSSTIEASIEVLPPTPSPEPVHMAIPLSLSHTDEVTDCEYLIDDQLTPNLFDDLTPQNAYQWIQEDYPISRTKVLTDPSPVTKGHIVFRWGYKGVRYEAIFDGPTLLIRRSYSQMNYAFFPGMAQSPLPTLKEVLHCLGDPAYYSASLETKPGTGETFFNLELWYPSHGMTVDAGIHQEGSQINQITDQLNVYSITSWGKPALTMEEFVAHTFDNVHNYDAFMRNLHPWKAGLRQIEAIIKPTS